MRKKKKMPNDTAEIMKEFSSEGIEDPRERELAQAFATVAGLIVATKPDDEDRAHDLHELLMLRNSILLTDTK